ncbi:uncharacterized protein [Montipora foliosa]|uniref:uncharacterized protein isoform X1 n=1 Tax=Montipora foliosa TaxID=591990 RepID=UPI0035F129C0
MSMRLWKQSVDITVLVAICVLLAVGDSRSVGSLKAGNSKPTGFLSQHQSHKIKKRSLYEETCPPPYVIEVTEQCKDTCLDDDYCVGNQMCCFDGCSYVCMDPVPSEAVIDWIDDKPSSLQENVGNPELEIINPVIEELGCYYRGMMFTDGERIPLGCKLCSCFNGNLMCDVANCNKEYQARLALELSGSGSGDDEDDDDDDVSGKASGNGNRYPIVKGLEYKEEFVPFEELQPNKKKPSGLNETSIPIPMGDNEIEQSGEEENGSGTDSGDSFVPYDEETKDENNGDNVASFARRLK